MSLRPHDYTYTEISSIFSKLKQIADDMYVVISNEIGHVSVLREYEDFIRSLSSSHPTQGNSND